MLVSDLYPIFIFTYQRIFFSCRKIIVMYINKFILWFVSEAVSAQIYPGWFIPYILFAFALLSHKSCNYNCPDVRIDKLTILFLMGPYLCAYHTKKLHFAVTMIITRWGGAVSHFLQCYYQPNK